MKKGHVKTFESFITEAAPKSALGKDIAKNKNESTGFENDKKFWNSLTHEEQVLIMKDFGYGAAPSKKSYDGLHTEFYEELRNYLISIKYDKKFLGKNPQKYT